MIKRVLSIAVVIVLLAGIMPVGVVNAEPETVNMKLDMVCCTQSVRVYGDGQPRVDGKTGDCVAPVVFDKDAELQAAEEAGASGESEDGMYQELAQKEKQLASTRQRFLNASNNGLSDEQRRALQQELYQLEEEVSSLRTQVRSIQAVGSVAGVGLIPLVVPSVIVYQILDELYAGAKNALGRLAKVVFDSHTKQYHAFMDEEFAEAISMVTEYETSDELNEKLNVYDGFCRGKNPKPECVAQRLLCSHEKYGQVLYFEAGQNVVNSREAAGDIQRLLQVVQERDQALLEEAHHAERALETSVAVYDQFFQTYRLHLRLKEMVQSLLKVKIWTGHLRTLMGCFPNKFVGVATTKCN